MPDPDPVPEEAVALAAVALHDDECPDRHCGGSALSVYYGRARVALNAGAEAIRADERKQVHADRVVSAVFACDSEDCPRPFALWRDGEKYPVAHGVQFAPGLTAVRWTDGRAAWFDSVEGAEGFTRSRAVWLAAEFSEMARAEREAVAAERDRIKLALLGCITCGKIHGDYSEPGHRYKARWADQGSQAVNVASRTIADLIGDDHD